MDELIEKISRENNNPGLRDDLVGDLWNSPLGKEYDSPEAINAALTEGTDVRITAAARQWLGLHIFE